MEEQKSNLFFMVNSKHLPKDKIGFLKRQFMNCGDITFDKRFAHIELYDTTKILLFSFLFGSFGLDRFMIKDIKMGLLKFFSFASYFMLLFITLDAFAQEIIKSIFIGTDFSNFIYKNLVLIISTCIIGITNFFLMLYDWFTITITTKERNFDKLMDELKRTFNV